MKRLIKIDIEYRPKYKAVSITEPRHVYYRNDNVFAWLYQMEKGQPLHMISYKTSGSKTRALKWAKLKRRRLLQQWYKSWGLLFFIKYCLQEYAPVRRK